MRAHWGAHDVFTQLPIKTAPHPELYSRDRLVACVPQEPRNSCVTSFALRPARQPIPRIPPDTTHKLLYWTASPKVGPNLTHTNIYSPIIRRVRFRSSLVWTTPSKDISYTFFNLQNLTVHCDHSPRLAVIRTSSHLALQLFPRFSKFR